MNPPQKPVQKRAPRKNLIAIDGTLDRLERIRVTVHEKGKEANPFDLRIQHRDAVLEHVDCSDPDCFNGGFSLGDLIRDMVRGGQVEFIGTNFCTGQLGDPEERGSHPSCGTRFDIEAILLYRDTNH